MMVAKPLDGLLVLEFCQYLSGPSAGLRLADLGARVIKVERPDGGDAGRRLAIKDLWVDEDSLLFHTINRNKESITVDINSTSGIATLRALIEQADVLIHNFRPGIMEKKGLGYDVVSQWNPRLVYGAISGYGSTGPWAKKPGQDLLLQSLTGLAHTTGTLSDAPTPFGIAIADILCGAQLVQGILAGLIRRQRSGNGALIEISLIESLLDFQFELLTTYFTSEQVPLRSAVAGGHPLLGAPYGVYATADGYIALAMMDLRALGEVLQHDLIGSISPDQYFTQRDSIKNNIAGIIETKSTAHWLVQLHAADLWAMEVLNWQQLSQEEAYRVISMEQKIIYGDRTITTTRCPIKIDGALMVSSKSAPKLGADTEKIRVEFNINE